MTLVSTLAKFKRIANVSPLTKGILAYSILWPTGSLIQQTVEGKRFGEYDWKRCLRFSLYGGLFVAPTLYGWVRLSSVMWPRTNFKSGITKALVDQISYGPFSMVSFYIGMSFLEFKSFDEAVQELRSKMVPTYKVAVCFWPFIQTINFSIIPERNRVVFISICSVLWTTFLAYMKQIDKESLDTKAIICDDQRHYDWWRCLRFSLYGGLFVAPTLYAWIRISTIMWPQRTLQSGVTKAIVEQISYTPAAITSFYFIMSLLQNKTVREAVSEVEKKFAPTYKVALSVWPLVGLINFTLIPERNRVPFISVCSLIWTTFLAYMKHLEHHQIEEHKIL